MTIESIISAVAPTSCLVCAKKGSGLCVQCTHNHLELAPSRCYRCHKATGQSQVCPNCRAVVRLDHLWAVTMYEGLAKDILHKLKFERASYLSKDIAKLMLDLLPIFPVGTIICHVPTAPSRIRVRGYDQSRLIAKCLAKAKGLEYKNLLTRISNSRQLGASREKRFQQAKTSFRINNPDQIKNAKILIVDDVTTSGASLEHIAKMLKKSGAKSVDAVVFAQATN